MTIDRRFSRALAVALDRARQGFEMFAAGLPGLRLAVPASDLEFKPGMAIHSLRELPVRWDEP
jgi:hypothetical protein